MQTHCSANVNFICLHNDRPLHPQLAAAKLPLMVVVLARGGLDSFLIEVRVKVLSLPLTLRKSDTV